MYNSNFLLLIIFSIFSNSIWAENHLNRIKDSSALKIVLDAVGTAYVKGPNFNTFYYSDNFSFLAFDAQDPAFTWVYKEDLRDKLNLFIENALEWGDETDVEIIMENRSQALHDLEQIVGEEPLKYYMEVRRRSYDYSSHSYYIGEKHQFWFEESWAL